MLRHFGAIAAATILCATTAFAGPDWTKYGSFQSTRCESASTIADIKNSLQDLKFDDGGGYSFGTASKVQIASSKTLKATPNILVCQLRLTTIEGGRDHFYNSRYTITLLPKGRWKTHFQPNY